MTTTVTFRARRPDGGRIAGYIRFTPSTRLVGGSPVESVLPVPMDIPVRTVVAEDGTVVQLLEVLLDSTDDPAYSPAGWAWKAEPVLIHGLPREFFFYAPSSETVDLSTVAPVEAPDGEWVTRGDPGHTPVLEWEGTALSVDGVLGPDLRGEPGADGVPAEPTAAEYASPVVVVDPGVDLATITATVPTTVSVGEGVDGQHVVVHIAAGSGLITWDQGITIVGDILTDEAWVTLVKTASGWTLLAPQPGGGGELSGWLVSARDVSTDVITAESYGPNPPERNEDDGTVYRDNGRTLQELLESFSLETVRNLHAVRSSIKNAGGLLDENIWFPMGTPVVYGMGPAWAEPENGSFMPGYTLEVKEVDGAPVMTVTVPDYDSVTGDFHPLAGKTYRLALEEVTGEE